MTSPLVDFTLSRLREFLAVPQWHRGGRLPTELDLAREIGVSRPVIRKALSVLREEGVIESLRGSGNYVRAVRTAQSDVYGQPRNLQDIENCFRFRGIIETAAAVEAAKHRTPAQIKEIERTLALMHASQMREQDVFEADFAFHLAVATAAGNPYFARTLEFLKPQIELGYMLGRQVRNIPPNITSKLVASEHQRVLEAIRDGNVHEALARMEAHINAGLQRFFGKESG